MKTYLVKIGPQCSKPRSLYYERSKRAYTRLLALLPTSLNCAGMG